MKLNIPRIFDKSKILSTEVGQQIQELVDFMADFVEQVTRAMRNQITIGDNMDAIVSEVTVKDQTETVINTNSKQPMGIYVLKVMDKDLGVDAMRWYVDENNQTKIWVKYTTLNASTNIRIAIHFN